MLQLKIGNLGIFICCHDYKDNHDVFENNLISRLAKIPEHMAFGLGRMARQFEAFQGVPLPLTNPSALAGSL